ncbi:signal peptidase I [Anaerocolumna sp. AGMB13025]|uniref:signal peptidase I n=1 Tax=Anaerocolumna sp. AGMB13025 TaxID=3039116 RepID=UPI002F4043FE
MENQELESNESRNTGGRTKKVFTEGLHLFFYLVIVILSTFLIMHFIGQRTQVYGQSMENTLSNQDSLIVDKISYHFAKPHRFDIVVFPVDDKKNIYYIKRIIGLPGETVQIIDGKIYINNKLLKEDYGKEVIAIDREGLAAQPVMLGKGDYFVLGDNRNHSMDSRDPEVGNISKSSIIGKAWVRVWPLKKFGFLNH